MLRYLVGLVVCACLAACAARVDPTVLRKPAVVQTIVLKTELAYFFTGGNTQVFLSPGIYVAELEDEGGTFFRGPDKCYGQRHVKKPELDASTQGGIWISKAAGGERKFRVYHYIENKNSGKEVFHDPQLTGQTPSMTSYVATGIVYGGMGALAAGENGKILIHSEPPPSVRLVDYLR